MGPCLYELLLGLKAHPACGPSGLG